MPGGGSGVGQRAKNRCDHEQRFAPNNVCTSFLRIRLYGHDDFAPPLESTDNSRIGTRQCARKQCSLVGRCCREMSPGGHLCFVCFMHLRHAWIGPGGVRALAAESLMLKHQMLYRSRAPGRSASQGQRFSGWARDLGHAAHLVIPGARPWRPLSPMCAQYGAARSRMPLKGRVGAVPMCAQGSNLLFANDAYRPSLCQNPGSVRRNMQLSHS